MSVIKIIFHSPINAILTAYLALLHVNNVCYRMITFNARNAQQTTIYPEILDAIKRKHAWKINLEWIINNVPFALKAVKLVSMLVIIVLLVKKDLI